MRGEGATGGTWSWDPGPPPWVRGSIYKKKVLQDPGPNTHTAATIRKEVFDPPPPQRGTQVRGGGGVRGSKSKKSLGDHFWSENDDFYKGLDVRNHKLGYATRTTQKRGVYDARACA